MKFIGVDQHGQFFPIEKHPRKELMEMLGYKSASKMYIDTVQGGTKHIGYVVGPQWVQVWKVEPFKN